jgi:peptide/nickel transport system substrate-binding protein
MLRRKSLWLSAPVALVVLILSSCSSAPLTTAVPATKTALPPPATTTAKPSTTTTPSGDVPKYGGTLTYLGADPSGWDSTLTQYTVVSGLYGVVENLRMTDWKKGPIGTGEAGGRSTLGRSDLGTGALAESYELPDSTTIIYRIRKGVRWQNVPPVNGREFTATDVVFNLKRAWTSTKSYEYINFKSEQRPTSYNALDKYTVEVKVPAESQYSVFSAMGGITKMYPPESVQQFGDMTDWHGAVGTGPFVLKDYVVGSSLTYVRNPSYWQYDPVHPENRLPYVDGKTALIIPDLSTQAAAFRTGKIDILGEGLATGVSWEDGAVLKKQHPELKSNNRVIRAGQVYGRIDKPDLPFKDIRVRQALNMSINRQEIVDTYYGGNSQVFSLPPPTKEFAPIVTPFDQQPQAVKDLFSYNPTKAKQMLADAGYPNGFKTNLVCTTNDVDLMSIVKAYFAKIGVDMDIKPMEQGALTSLIQGKNIDQMVYRDYPVGVIDKLGPVRKENADDVSGYDSPRIRDAYDQMQLLAGRDETKRLQILKDLFPFILSEAVGVWMPTEYGYALWWPWVKGYYGELGGAGFSGQGTNGASAYAWVDKSLKQSMGY